MSCWLKKMSTNCRQTRSASFAARQKRKYLPVQKLQPPENFYGFYIPSRALLSGKTIIQPKFDTAYDFIDGIAEVYFTKKVTSAAGPAIQTVHAYMISLGSLFLEKGFESR